jgi:hypothetical protein
MSFVSSGSGGHIPVHSTTSTTEVDEQQRGGFENFPLRPLEQQKTWPTVPVSQKKSSTKGQQ